MDWDIFLNNFFTLISAILVVYGIFSIFRRRKLNLAGTACIFLGAVYIGCKYTAMGSSEFKVFFLIFTAFLNIAGLTFVLRKSKFEVLTGVLLIMSGTPGLYLLWFFIFFRYPIYLPIAYIALAIPSLFFATAGFILVFRKDKKDKLTGIAFLVFALFFIIPTNIYLTNFIVNKGEDKDFTDCFVTMSYVSHLEARLFKETGSYTNDMKRLLTLSERECVESGDTNCSLKAKRRLESDIRDKCNNFKINIGKNGKYYEITASTKFWAHCFLCISPEVEIRANDECGCVDNKIGKCL